MATAVSKPASHTPKMKRAPPPFIQTGVNGIKTSQPSASPQSSSKRLPGDAGSMSVSNVNGIASDHATGLANAPSGLGKGPIGRPKKETPRLGEHPSRLQRLSTHSVSLENERRRGKTCAEPYVKTTSYILKKYAKAPPSLIVHLHATHFRFEQQDGSFPYNSEMKVVIEHIRAGTVPHDMVEELLRAGVRFYEGCLIVRVVDHKSVSAQKNKSAASTADPNSEPFSIHNYNEHITPSAYAPYPKNSSLAMDKPTPRHSESIDENSSVAGSTGDAAGNRPEQGTKSKADVAPRPRVFTTVLHPTPRSLQAELTLLATTPDPKAVPRKPSAATMRTPSSATPQSPVVSTKTTDRGPVPKRQKMLVEPSELPECEAKLTRALAPPLFLDPVHSLEAAQDLLNYLESPLHRDRPPSPKRRKRTIAELAADEAMAAEEERFMLIMDERLEPTASGAAGAAKSSGIDDTGGAALFEPRFSRFKTLESIRMQHEEKAEQERQEKIKAEEAKRLRQEQERERRRIEQEQAKEEARRQQLAAQQAQAQLAAAQQQTRALMAHANGVTQGAQSSPVVRHQTPLNMSSPLAGNTMLTQGGIPMGLTASAQGAGSPVRPSSALQHPHPNVMGHNMVPSRSQQGHSRHGTPQMAQGTPAMSHATPIMRNVTPSQRINHGSPNAAQTPAMSQATIMGTPQMANGMGLTPQQQQFLLHQRQQHLLAQQGHGGQGQLTPQHLAQLQANIHAQQTLQNQQMMHAQQQGQQGQMPKNPNQQAYQAQLMRAQLAQMHMAQQQQRAQQTPQPQQQQQQQPGQMGQNQPHQGSPQMTPQQQQQQQMLLAAAQANGGQLPQNFQPANRYQHFFAQRLLKLRQDFAQRYMAQYGPPAQYPPQIQQQYTVGLEKAAKLWVQELMKREREQAQQQRANQVAAVQAQVLQHQQQQQQQQNMMQNTMGK